MHIAGHVSHLGGWTLLTNHATGHLDDIRTTAASLTLQPATQAHAGGNFRALHDHFQRNLPRLGWARDIRVTLQAGKRTAFAVDFLKESVALDLALGKQQFLLSTLYATLPLAFRAHALSLALILVPTRSSRDYLPSGVTNFEFTAQLLQEIPIHSIKYPFVILGLAPGPEACTEIELTTELDQYLIAAVGSSLAELIALSESPECDFKVDLPSNDTLAKEACAFANNKTGGLLIIGVTDDGLLPGVPSGHLDALQLKATDVIRARCDPCPEFEFRVFSNPHSSDTTILTIRIFALERRPCTIDGRVFVRSGPSARPANANEIRRLVGD